MTTAPLNAQLTGEQIDDVKKDLLYMLSFYKNADAKVKSALEIDQVFALAKSALSAEAPVEQDFWWLIENRSGGQLLYATCDSGDKRWTFNAPEAARFKTEAAAYNCMVQMRLAFHEHNGGYSGEKISAQQHGFIYANSVPAAPQAPLRNVLAELYEHTKWRDVPIAVLEAARLALELVPETTLAEVRCMPFDNCQYRYCDLPGQCVMEGKCHHPRPASSAAPQAVGERDAALEEAAKVCELFDDDIGWQEAARRSVRDWLNGCAKAVRALKSAASPAAGNQDTVAQEGVREVWRMRVDLPADYVLIVLDFFAKANWPDTKAGNAAAHLNCIVSKQLSALHHQGGVRG